MGCRSLKALRSANGIEEYLGGCVNSTQWRTFRWYPPRKANIACGFPEADVRSSHHVKHTQKRRYPIRMATATRRGWNLSTNQVMQPTPSSQTTPAVPPRTARYKRKALWSAVRAALVRLGIGACAIAVVSLAAAWIPWTNSGPNPPMWLDAVMAVPFVAAPVAVFLHYS